VSVVWEESYGGSNSKCGEEINGRKKEAACQLSSAGTTGRLKDKVDRESVVDS
jgi:hypothetical protein